jgi:hypothetical protein
MSNITKKVDRGIAETQRSQVFTQADASAGDILLVQDSLGKPAKTVHIDAVAAMTVRFNVLRTIYPYLPDAGGAIQNPRFDLANGQSVEDTSQAVLSIAAGETFSLDNNIAVTDIKIVTAAGSFEVFVA